MSCPHCTSTKSKFLLIKSWRCISRCALTHAKSKSSEVLAAFFGGLPGRLFAAGATACAASSSISAAEAGAFLGSLALPTSLCPIVFAFAAFEELFETDLEEEEEEANDGDELLDVALGTEACFEEPDVGGSC